ncbi:MAG TPA: sigma factor, partial [Armatimonadota bacterium]|nr:sigma factor [Armatimonadota bacterium]
MHQSEEQQLLEGLALGEFNDFWRIWQHHCDQLRSLCRRILPGQYDEVEDALSETMLRAYQELPPRAAEIDNLDAWLGRIAYNICIERWRRQS